MSKKSNIFFTGCPHYYHSNIIKYCNRPFLTDLDREALKNHGGQWHDGSWKGSRSSSWQITEEAVNMMNDCLIENINKLVELDDTLYILGDYLLSRYKYEERCIEIRNRINCRNIFLIFGNHDQYILYDLDIFRKIYDSGTFKFDNYGTFYLNHYANIVWNKSHRGSIHLYSHSHGSIENKLDELFPERRSMDVGVDNAYRLTGEFRPFSIKEIMDIMKHRKGSHLDHHVDPNTPEES